MVSYARCKRLWEGGLVYDCCYCQLNVVEYMPSPWGSETTTVLYVNGAFCHDVRHNLPSISAATVRHDQLGYPPCREAQNPIKKYVSLEIPRYRFTAVFCILIVFHTVPWDLQWIFLYPMDLMEFS